MGPGFHGLTVYIERMHTRTLRGACRRCPPGGERGRGEQKYEQEEEEDGLAERLCVCVRARAPGICLPGLLL